MVDLDIVSATFAVRNKKVKRTYAACDGFSSLLHLLNFFQAELRVPLTLNLPAAEQSTLRRFYFILKKPFKHTYIRMQYGTVVNDFFDASRYSVHLFRPRQKVL